MTDAEYVKDARAQLEMTQAKLADELGVTERAVSMWETGRIELTKSRRRQLDMLLRTKRKR